MLPGCIGLMLIQGNRMEMELGLSLNLWILENRKMIRVAGGHLEKHTLSGLGEISNHTWYHSHINDASCLLAEQERV